MDIRHNNDEASLAHPADILTGNYQSWKSSATDVGVVVVGGGVSGLTAVKTLLENNVTDILLLEADHRLGGRVRTYREGEILVEEGAEWIHGGRRNPLFRLAKKLEAVAPNLPDSAWVSLARTNKGNSSDVSRFTIVEDLMDDADENGILQPYYDTGYGQFYIDRFPEAYGEGWNSRLGEAWLHLLKQVVNGEEGANSWLDISARDADQYVDYGADHQWKNGYDTLISYLMESIPNDIIRMSTPVCKIYWDETEDGKVLLVTNNGNTAYSAKHVIVTASVGHLKDRHQHLFQPSLPSTYIKDLNGMELGVADKVQIGWSEPWWGTQDPLFLLILWTDMSLPKEMEWLYSIVAVFNVHQQTSVLQMFMTGRDAKRMEELPEETVKQHVLHLLATATGHDVPQPTFFTRSQWGQDPWYRGSYSSYVTVEGDRAGLHSRDRLAVPLVNSKGNTVVLWAGEHTHNTRYGTVDGAMKTGKREAINLLRIMKGKNK